MECYNFTGPSPEKKLAKVLFFCPPWVSLLVKPFQDRHMTEDVIFLPD